MARPRKDEGTPDAKHRIIDAFWELLEDHRLREITIKMVVDKANCNRGTFYYHYTDVDDLTYRAIEGELLGNSGLPNDIFNLVTGATGNAFERVLSGQRMMRLSLAMRQGGMEMVEQKSKAIIIDMWRTVLCSDGGRIKPETRAVFEYATSGVLGVIAYRGAKWARGEEAPIPEGFLETMSRDTLGYVCSIQGIMREDLLARLKMVNEFSRLAQG